MRFVGHVYRARPVKVERRRQLQRPGLGGPNEMSGSKIWPEFPPLNYPRDAALTTPPCKLSESPVSISSLCAYCSRDACDPSMVHRSGKDWAQIKECRFHSRVPLRLTTSLSFSSSCHYYVECSDRFRDCFTMVYLRIDSVLMKRNWIEASAMGLMGYIVSTEGLI